MLDKVKKFLYDIHLSSFLCCLHAPCSIRNKMTNRPPARSHSGRELRPTACCPFSQSPLRPFSLLIPGFQIHFKGSLITPYAPIKIINFVSQHDGMYYFFHGETFLIKIPVFNKLNLCNS